VIIFSPAISMPPLGKIPLPVDGRCFLNCVKRSTYVALCIQKAIADMSDMIEMLRKKTSNIGHKQITTLYQYPKPGMPV